MSVFVLDVIHIDGFLMSSGCEGIVDNTVVRLFRVVVSVVFWISDPL
jgi:hypothetical protein